MQSELFFLVAVVAPCFFLAMFFLVLVAATLYAIHWIHIAVTKASPGQTEFAGRALKFSSEICNILAKSLNPGLIRTFFVEFLI